MKSCPDCCELLPLDSFPRNARMGDGHSLYCRSCYSLRARESYVRRREAEGKAVRPRVTVPDGHKRCPRCSEVKPTEAFPRNRSARNGLGAYCKPCHNVTGKETYTRLYGSTREYHLRRRYGVTSAQVDEMIEAQFGKCAVCQTAQAEHVDHDHETGAVRGILCFNCNGALGHVRDRPDVLLAAIDYLRTHAPTKEKGRTWRKTLEAPGVYRLSS